MTETKEIIQSESKAQLLLEKAIEGKLPVESIERLVKLYEDFKKERAKESYFLAYAKFQSECPVIKKTKDVFDKSGKIRYSFAPLEDIVSQVKEPLSKNGFSYSIQNEVAEDGLRAHCDVHHVDGHSERSTFFAPIDKDAYMSEPQKWASAGTFAKRYAFINALGILTADEDDDNASGVSEKPKAKSRVEDLLAEADTIKTEDELDAFKKKLIGIGKKLNQKDFDKLVQKGMEVRKRLTSEVIDTPKTTPKETVSFSKEVEAKILELRDLVLPASASVELKRQETIKIRREFCGTPSAEEVKHMDTETLVEIKSKLENEIEKTMAKFEESK